MRHINNSAFVVAGLSTVLAACATTTDLQPAPAANQVTGVDEAARSAVENVTMVVQAGDWPGIEEVERHVVPLEVEIRNDSDKPLRVRYEEFALVGPEGQRYSALPPRRIDATVSGPALNDDFGPVDDPYFDANNYTVAPFYGPAYPTLTPFAGPFTIDPLFYGNYWGYWENTELPTEAMLERAIPEGVLEPGGSVHGYLYFEDVPPEVPVVQYRAELVNANTSDAFGTITIPFTVDEG